MSVSSRVDMNMESYGRRRHSSRVMPWHSIRAFISLCCSPDGPPTRPTGAIALSLISGFLCHRFRLWFTVLALTSALKSAPNPCSGIRIIRGRGLAMFATFDDCCAITGNDCRSREENDSFFECIASNDLSRA